MENSKPYEIPKQTVMPHKKVKANKGSAGIDGKDFEKYEKTSKTTCTNCERMSSEAISQRR